MRNDREREARLRQAVDCAVTFLEQGGLRVARVAEDAGFHLLATSWREMRLIRIECCGSPRGFTTSRRAARGMARNPATKPRTFGALQGRAAAVPRTVRYGVAVRLRSPQAAGAGHQKTDERGPEPSGRGRAGRNLASARDLAEFPVPLFLNLLAKQAGIVREVWTFGANNDNWTIRRVGEIRR